MDKNIKNIVNFRDLAGLSGRFGTLKANKLLRGANLNQVTAAEMQYLVTTKQLKTVVDFRSYPEKLRTPNFIYPSVTYLDVDILNSQSDKAPGEFHHAQTAKELQAAIDSLNQVYYDFVANPKLRQKFAEFIQIVLNQTEGAIYYHCMAGKDRTGFATIVLLKILGIDEADIKTDYLYTNIARQEHNARALKHIAQRLPLEMTAEIERLLLTLLGVTETSYNNIDLAIKEHFTDWDNFLVQGLNLSTADIEHLRKRYLK